MRKRETVNGFAREEKPRVCAEVLAIVTPDFEDRSVRAGDMTDHDPRFASRANDIARPEGWRRHASLWCRRRSASLSQGNRVAAADTLRNLQR
jgi:hypothetical protein